MYRIEITRAAAKQLRRIDNRDRQRIESAIADLAEAPRPAGCKPLVGRDATWRIRIGDYRVLYEVHDDRLVVVVIRVAHRRDVYR